MRELIREELNVKDVVLRDNEEELVEYSAKANFKVLGKSLGKDMKEAAARIEALGGRDIRTLLAGGTVELRLAGRSVPLTAEAVLVTRTEKEHLKVLNEGSLTVALDPELTEELVHEGLVRDLVRGHPEPAQGAGPGRDRPHRRWSSPAPRSCRAPWRPSRRGSPARPWPTAGPGGGTRRPSRWSAGRRAPTCTCARADEAAARPGPWAASDAARCLRQLLRLLASWPCCWAPAPAFPPGGLAESPWASLSVRRGPVPVRRRAAGPQPGWSRWPAASVAAPRARQRARCWTGRSRSTPACTCAACSLARSSAWTAPGGERAGARSPPPSWPADRPFLPRSGEPSHELQLRLGAARVRPAACTGARAQPLEVGCPAPGRLLLAACGRPGALERMMARRCTPQAAPVERAREGDPRVGPFLAGAAALCLPAGARARRSQRRRACRPPYAPALAGRPPGGGPVRAGRPGGAGRDA